MMAPDSLNQARLDWNLLADQLAEEGDLPGASEIIKFVLSVKPEDELSAQELAALILKDYGLTNRVLRMANSCFYNPSGTEITTVSKAIVFLGFDFIREIALATGFLEAVLTRTPKEQKDLVLHLLSRSYLGAFLARKLSPYLGLDYEELFICTLFHRLLRILLAIYAPKAYFKLLELERERPALVRKKLFQMGERLARKWSLPRALTETLEGSPRCEKEEGLAALVKKLDQATRALADQGDLQPLKDLLREAGLGEALARDFAEDAKRALKDLHPPLSNHIKFQLRKSETTPEKPSRRDDFYQKAVAEITSLLASPKTHYQQILLMVIETICRTFSCENVSLAIVNPKSKELVIRYGVGRKGNKLRGKTLPLGPLIGDIFRKQAEWSGKVVHIPEASIFAESWPEGDLLFCPLIVFEKPVGMILAVREQPFTLEDHQKVATLRNLAVLAIVQERQRKST